MTRLRWRAGLCLAALLATATMARAQGWRQPPRIGYASPAGGRQGETVQVTVGGQYLKDVAEVLISGGGVTAELTDYDRPPTGKELAQIREVWNEARKKAQAEAKGGRRARLLAIRRTFVTMAKDMGITEKQIDAFNRFRKQRNDPKRQLNPQLSEWVTLRVTVAADAEPGARELCLTTPNGLSNPVRFLVGRLPEYRESEPNDTLSAATAVASLPAVLNGQIMPGDVDRFRFPARKGQHLVIDVGARELVPYLADAVPGWFQATVALCDADGRQVAYADDYRFDPDPVLLYEVPHDGDYVVEIKDSIYRGREDFVYRITLGELPFVSGIFPLGGRRGQTTTVAVEGWNLPADERTLHLSPEQTGIQQVRVHGTARGSNAVPFDVADLPECREQEPNDGTSGAGKLTVPTIVNGRIDRPGDRDVFRFHARRGDRIVAEVLARRLGSPLDSGLRITDAAGTVLAENDDHVDKGHGLVTHHADSLAAVTIPSTGDYLLWLGDVQHKGGPAYAYRLRVSRAQPDFDLRVVPSVINARGGTAVPITVYALRRDGFSDDIRLRLRDAPKGFQLSGAWVPAGRDQVRLTLSVPAKPEEKLTRLSLEGVATVDGRELCRAAAPANDMMQAFIYHHLVLMESWTVAVQPARWNRRPWTIAADMPVKLTPGETTVLRVRLPGRPPPGRILMQLSDPPEGITIQKVTPLARGLDVTLRADAGKAQAGLRGNLIIDVVVEREPPEKEGQAKTKVRRIPLGPLPALPFEIVSG